MTKSNISIVTRLENYRKAAEELEIPISKEEWDEIKENIEDHARYIWERLNINLSKADELKSEAKKLTEAAKSLTNQSINDKEYLLEALEKSGFERVKFGNFEMKVRTRKTLISKRPAIEKDFTAYSEIVKPSFSWNRDPEIDDLLNNRELVETHYEWDLNKIKEDKEKYKQFFDYKVSKFVTVKINKEGKK